LQSTDGNGTARAVRQAVILGIDALATAVALHVAMALRFEGRVPELWSAALLTALPLAVGARVACNAATRLHGWSFRMAGLADAVRIAVAGVLGTILFWSLVQRLVPTGLPRTVYALEFFLSTTAFGVLRFGPRVGLRWWGERLRRRAGAARTIIVGTEASAELLARDLKRDPEGRYDVVGFVGDDPSLQGCRIDGTPVLGTIRDLPLAIRRNAISTVLLAIARPSGESVREIIETCATCRVRFKIVPASPTELEAAVSAAMLNDLAPEDLLTRQAVVFDEAEIGTKVSGRRVLVTGAGGSIGGEICRQLVRYGVKRLVMVDMNENELYLSARRLAEKAPGIEIRAEVADVRERDRLDRLGERYRPEYVFHAAAHKHVPLMEDAPEEAVKNNVFGTLNVARMADACGAERFVLISTDKAVNPTSVMGASKRVAELVVRDLARRSRTRMTAVRFGNVLGSAGSIVPIFKQQIERGGPVTVTHPDCVRFFMTIPEAVGLVLVAGLGDYGELCVLDMGEPIRIEELARSMITLSGHVPGVEIPIVYTGLRPGEKLFEELLTEEEEQTTAARDRIFSARSPAPPFDLHARLGELLSLSHEGDREGVLHALKRLVPSYRPARGGVGPVLTPVPVPVREPAAAPEGRGRAGGAAAAFGSLDLTGSGATM
jgi:FlaA1/EpsC-like NDP-sugar epimerase